MSRFEYGLLMTFPNVIHEWLPTGASEFELRDLMYRLNELGEQGWELVGYDRNEVGGQALYLKRALA